MVSGRVKGCEWWKGNLRGVSTRRGRLKGVDGVSKGGL